MKQLVLYVIEMNAICCTECTEQPVHHRGWHESSGVISVEICAFL